MFYSVHQTENLSLECSLSDKELLQRGKGGARIHSSKGRPGRRSIKRILLIKENQTSQVKEFNTFLCMGRCQHMGSLISFL